jgi:hypothetical protein
MLYGTYRRAGCFIGSGVVGARLKCSGMRWTEEGASHVLALRCLVLSGLFEASWSDFVRQLASETARD